MTTYPLSWPAGQARTKEPVRSRFGRRGRNGGLVDRTNYHSRWFLESEVDRLKGTAPVISTNLRVRQDGGFVSRAKEPEDSGVAVYFNHNSRHICIACDTYQWVWENLYAIGRTIEGFRRMERDGIPGFLDKAFTGFTAIEYTGAPWPEVLGLNHDGKYSLGEVKAQYRTKLIGAHPDHGGSREKMDAVKAAYEEALRELEAVP